MPFYNYTAKNREGQVYERSVEARDRFALYKIIREEGGTVLSVEEGRGLKSGLSIRKLFSRVKAQQKINFAKNLSSMIKAGLPVTRALSVMSKQTKHEAFKKLLSDLEADVSHGLTLSDALGKHPKVFSSLFVSMVRAGEESGSVSDSLRTVGNQLEKASQLSRKVRGAMIYPLVIIAVMIVISILLLVFMVPTLTATFAGLGVELPLPTRILIGLSNFLVNNTLSVFSVVLLVAASIATFFKSKKGKEFFDHISIGLPVIGQTVREVQTARTARTLSSLLSAGVEIVSAIDVTTEVIQNHLYKNALKETRAAIQKGDAISDVFERNEYLYPLFVAEMVSVGEETGKISEMLLGVADYYEEQIDQKTKDLSTIIEPVLMIMIGIGVGIFAVAMLAPTYSLVDYM